MGSGIRSMTGELLEAFRCFGPLLGDNEVDGVRNAAAETLSRELRALAARIATSSVDRAICDDAVQIVLLRLCRRGPRGIRERDPKTDEDVRGYLFTAARNAVRDLLPREHQIDEYPPLPQPEPSPPPPAIPWEKLWAVAQDITATLRKDAAADFLATIGELIAIAQGEKSFEALVEAQVASGENRDTVRNRFYKRYSRALQKFEETFQYAAAAATRSADDQRILRVLVDLLRLRPRG